MASYKITRRAVEDLSSIWYCTCQIWSRAMADKYYFDLVRTIGQIASKPAVAADREYTEIKHGLFGRPCGKHIIFYRLDTKKNVLILRVLHKRMDVVRQLS